MELVKIFALSAVFILFLSFGCTAPVDRTGQNGSNEPIVGGDRDAHGCIGSAGYQWCSVLDRCIRPFEEPCKKVVVSDTAQQHCSDSGATSVYSCDVYYYRVAYGEQDDYLVVAGDGQTGKCNPNPENMTEWCRNLIIGADCEEVDVCK